MAGEFVGISLQDIKSARQQVGEQQREHGAKMSRHPYAQWINDIPRERTKAFAERDRLQVRRMVSDEVVRQGSRITPDQAAPLFHPDVLSEAFDAEIARGEVMPVVVPMEQTESGLEVPLYTIDAVSLTPGTPLGELVEEADPEHKPVVEVMKVIRGEGQAVVERMGQDPETTSIQVVRAPQMLSIFTADAVSVRKTVTATPASLPGKMVTVEGRTLGLIQQERIQYQQNW